MARYPWLWLDRSSYHDAALAAADNWPSYVYVFQGVMATNQEPNHAPPQWWATAGQETAIGNWINIPVAFLNSKREQQQRAMTQIGPRDTTTAQSAALQAALAASLRAAQGRSGR